MDSWSPTMLREVVAIKHGYAFKGEFFSEEPTCDVLVTPGNFRVGGGFQIDKPKYYDGPTYPDFALAPGDLLVTMTDLSKGADTLGYPAIVPSQRDMRFLHNQRIGKVTVTDEEKLEKGFLYYLLCSRPYRNHVIATASGSTVRHTSPDRILEFAFKRPPLLEQRAIAHILGTLDDKIELNRRMNQTLEEMARALFHSWFVAFDPVRAKAAGHQPAGMDAATAALFPDSFEETKDGEIPAGWHVGKVGDLVQIAKQTLNPATYSDELFDHYSLPAFDAGRNPVVEHGSAIRSNKMIIEPGAVLISKLNPHIPRVWLPELARKRRSICSTEFLVAIPNDLLAQPFVYMLFTSEPFTRTFASLVTGTTGSHQRVNSASLLGMRIVVASERLISCFCSIVDPLLQCTVKNQSENTMLAKTRDLLLPKLLSGEVRVFEANGHLEEA